jgi:mono/diheme cytochrome c family protein
MLASHCFKYIVLCLPLAIAAQSGSGGDAYRGAEVLQKENCIQCHSIRGDGGKTAPDLGVRTSHQYTPALMASTMWNHAPAMWSAMSGQGVARPQISDGEARDLFAYFYSIRYFDKPGEAERGKRLFTDKHCGECHAFQGETGSAGPGKPVNEWTSMSDPMALVQQMWNHSALMKRALASRKLPWVELTSQDLTDLTVFVQNLPALRNKPSGFWLAEPSDGEVLFKSKGCAGCHTGTLSLDQRLSGQTLTDVAAALWNHAPRMVDSPMISTDEMRQIVSYIWEKQYLGAPGNAGRGSHVFESKHCATCHSGRSDAPYLGRGEKVYTPIAMVSVLWKHGPAMLERMQAKQIAWPRLSPEDMSDVVAFLNTKP